MGERVDGTDAAERSAEWGVQPSSVADSDRDPSTALATRALIRECQASVSGAIGDVLRLGPAWRRAGCATAVGDRVGRPSDL